MNAMEEAAVMSRTSCHWASLGNKALSKFQDYADRWTMFISFQ